MRQARREGVHSLSTPLMLSLVFIAPFSARRCRRRVFFTLFLRFGCPLAARHFRSFFRHDATLFAVIAVVDAAHHAFDMPRAHAASMPPDAAEITSLPGIERRAGRHAAIFAAPMPAFADFIFAMPFFRFSLHFAAFPPLSFSPPPSRHFPAHAAIDVFAFLPRHAITLPFFAFPFMPRAQPRPCRFADFSLDTSFLPFSATAITRSTFFFFFFFFPARRYRLQPSPACRFAAPRRLSATLLLMPPCRR